MKLTDGFNAAQHIDRLAITLSEERVFRNKTQQMRISDYGAFLKLLLTTVQVPCIVQSTDQAETDEGFAAWTRIKV